MRLNSSGNLLLKTDGTDGGNGRIQLASHTTSAGGIGFGSDVSLFRSAAGTLFTTAATFTLPSTGDLRWDGGGYVTIGASSSLVFRNLSAATILTLDGSSQNATFAGKVYVGNTDTGLARISAATGALQTSGNTIAFWTTGLFSMWGGTALRLGTAYTAGAPTATGYVTIQDSSGTTYKVLVGT